jgi:hypothetical protein
VSLLFTIDIEGATVVDALAFEAYPLIKPWLWRIIGVAHVPFAKEAGFITLLLKIRWKKLKSGWQWSIIVNNCMCMCILAGKNGSAAWGTKGSCHERIFQMRSFSCHPVHIRCFQPRHLIHKPHEIIPVIVGKNEYNVHGLAPVPFRNRLA